MERLIGSYNKRDRAIKQLEAQHEPTAFTTVGDWSVPSRGSYTYVSCQRGYALLYVSSCGETPLYYSFHKQSIHWHEHKLALPGKPSAVAPGSALLWSPSGVSSPTVETLPRFNDPAPDLPPDVAKKQYWELLVRAVERRLRTTPNGAVAVAQSGGIDSSMVTRAIIECGRTVVPLTACTTASDWDVENASLTAQRLGLSTFVPIWVTPRTVTPQLIREGYLCYERAEDRFNNFKNVLCNLLMARKCQELGIETIFTGHGQDTIHGVGITSREYFRDSSKLETFRNWQQLRRTNYLGDYIQSMLKHFSTAFRRYGVSVRHPYFDWELNHWSLQQPESVIPWDKGYKEKPLALSVARLVLPHGPWSEEKYSSPGYGRGSGLATPKGEEFMKTYLNSLGGLAAEVQAQGWQKIHKEIQETRIKNLLA